MARRFIKWNSNQVFSYEYCEIFKNIYFEEHLWTAASGSYKSWKQKRIQIAIKHASQVENLRKRSSEDIVLIYDIVQSLLLCRYS